MTTITYQGKKWKVTRKVIQGSTSTMSVNIADTRTKIFAYECPRHRMWQFRKAQSRRNEIWMYLADAADENDDDAKIRVYRADNDENWDKSVWEGVYGQIPSTANRGDVNHIVVPDQEVRYEEGEIMMVDLDDDEAITVANSKIELRVEEFLVHRED